MTVQSSMFPNSLIEFFKRCRVHGCKLFVAVSLLLTTGSGCTGARATTTAARPQSDTRIGSRVPGPSAAEESPGVVEVYPDFRGRRATGPGLRGPGLPPHIVPEPPADGLVEPPPFPGVDERDNGGPAASRPRHSSQDQIATAARHRSLAPSLAIPISQRRPANSSALPAGGVAQTASATIEPKPVEATSTPLAIDEPRRTAQRPRPWSLRYLPGRNEATNSSGQGGS
jgi:hypothetical protein